MRATLACLADVVFFAPDSRLSFGAIASAAAAAAAQNHVILTLSYAPPLFTKCACERRHNNPRHNRLRRRRSLQPTPPPPPSLSGSPTTEVTCPKLKSTERASEPNHHESTTIDRVRCSDSFESSSSISPPSRRREVVKERKTNHLHLLRQCSEAVTQLRAGSLPIRTL